jgi:Spy/CpxP family protein refolding chaperone
MKKVLFLSIIVPLLFAQPSDEQDPRAIVEKIRMWRLTQELDLSTEQAAVLFPKLNELRKIEKNYNEEKRQVLVELRGLLSRDASDIALTKVLSRYETLNRQKMEMQIEKTKEIMVILTPVQQARYLIFEDEFNREIREMIREVKKLKDLKR